MKKRFRRYINLVLIVAMTVTAIGSVALNPLQVYATTIQEIKDMIAATQSELADVNDNIDVLSEEQELILEQIDDLNAEIINLMTSIDMKEGQIAETEQNIAVTQEAYDAAVIRQEEQHDALELHIQLMYELGTPSLFDILMQSTSLADFLNRANYTERVYEYGYDLLREYEQTSEEIHTLWDQLEAEKADLEAEKASLEDTREYCDTLLAELRTQADEYNALIAQAERQAAQISAQLQEEQRELKRLQEEERRRQEEERRRQAAEAAAAAAAAAAANGNNGNNNSSTPSAATTNYTDTVNNATGSDLGKKIALYALQFVGNPYVAGGTSLTNGADCSGFTYRVYSDYGYTLPRTSYEQRSAGVSVEYANAQPGDLICYSGHVALYIGGGLIVHASSERTGIKVSNANYRTILAVRRIVS